ncbi:enoyl-CoA hydratase/isomerase family protein [Pararhizobium haloflavum]|uniref:enoyl-CoA hydratase/isomerase family protein n=1 Tax=Pararhizobium haloflavum TaxID=2037914 RepID=UPI000C195C32|nr:enoyl-CoA hydratase/isomerase family protein [Pararhizobium haloflavum]
MTDVSGTITRREGRAGRITLNRPQALNALTHEMAGEIEAALLAWRDDDDIALVIIDAVGERAFCAGGDIQDLYRTGKSGDFSYGRRFWADEYRLNALIDSYPKPYVAVMDGITMGGGVGIAAHGSHRIVTERTVLAMPECGIGLIPDVGGSMILGHAPGRLGLYLGLTGKRLKADGAILTGFADAFVPSQSVAELTARLIETGDADGALSSLAVDPDGGALRELQAEIKVAFAGSDPADCLRRLDDASADGNWQAEAAKAMRRASPLSIQCAHAAILKASEISDLRDALKLEYRFSWRCMEHGDFLEGVRAQIIDKDRNPHWRHRDIDAAAHDAAKMLESLGDDELVL